jgi:hypothetical protein
MGQELQTWRSGGDRQWLSMLVATMEEVSRPEFRAVPCEPELLAALLASLTRPRSVCVPGASSCSPRN